MKKVKAFVIVFLIVMAAQSQYHSLQLRAKDWSWLIGKYGISDSADARMLRKIQAVAANTTLTSGWETQITVDSIPQSGVIKMYTTFIYAPLVAIDSMGETAAEKTNIQIKIRALNNTELQHQLRELDKQGGESEFIRPRNTGKFLVLDN